MQTSPRARGVTLGWILFGLFGAQFAVAWLFEAAVQPGLLRGEPREDAGSRVVQQAE